jgi:alpha-L-fucosidase
VSIRRGWFWHPDQEPKSLDDLMEIYFKSVGRNCVLLLNVPPDDRGLLPEADVERLYAFKAALDAIFAIDLALNKRATASTVRGSDPAYSADRVLDHDLTTYWATDDDMTTGTVEIDLGAPTTFNVVRLQEPVALDQRIEAYRVEAWDGAAWTPVSTGTTIGHKKLDRFEAVTAQRVRLVVEAARACPLIAEFGVHLDPRAQGE